jgi:hypothetical protein
MEVSIVGYRKIRQRHETPPITADPDDELDMFSVLLFLLGFILFNFA